MYCFVMYCCVMYCFVMYGRVKHCYVMNLCDVLLLLFHSYATRKIADQLPLITTYFDVHAHTHQYLYSFLFIHVYKVYVSISVSISMRVLCVCLRACVFIRCMVKLCLACEQNCT